MVIFKIVWLHQAYARGWSHESDFVRFRWSGWDYCFSDGSLPIKAQSEGCELHPSLLHCCEVFIVMHWFVRLYCNELSLMYKNKDFLQKTYHHFLYFCSDNNRLLAFFRLLVLSIKGPVCRIEGTLLYKFIYSQLGFR